MRQQWRNERALLPVGGRSSVSFFFPNKNMTQPHIKRFPPKLDVLPVCFCCKFLTLHPESIENRLLSVNDHRGFYVYKKKKTRCAEMSRWRSSPRGFVTVPLLLHYEKCIELEALFLLFSLSFILSCVFFFQEKKMEEEIKADGRRNETTAGISIPGAANPLRQTPVIKFYNASFLFC